MRAKLAKSLATETLPSSHLKRKLLPICSMADDHTDSDVPITLLADDDDKPEISKAIATLNETRRGSRIFRT